MLKTKSLSRRWLCSAARGACAEPPAPPAAPRIYVFDNGNIKGLDPKLFNFTRQELKEVDFMNIAYLIVHPRGTLMFDSGAVADSHFKGDGAPVAEGIMSATKPLMPQLAAAGHYPADITYLAMSHYHSDHTANANDFAGATWIVQKAERDFMLAEAAGHRAARSYASSKRQDEDLDNEDFDVFGDGSVVIMSAPGHTPGINIAVTRETRHCGALGRPIPLSGGADDGKDPDVRVQCRQSKASRAKDREVREGQQGRALDRARHRDARELAEGAAVRRVAFRKAESRSRRRFGNARGA